MRLSELKFSEHKLYTAMLFAIYSIVDEIRCTTNACNKLLQFGREECTVRRIIMLFNFSNNPGKKDALINNLQKAFN